MVAVQQERGPGGAIASIEALDLSVTDPAASYGPIRGWLARSRAPAALPGLCRSTKDFWEHAALRLRSGNGCMRLAKAAAAAANQLPLPPLRGSSCAHRNTGVSLTAALSAGGLTCQLRAPPAVQSCHHHSSGFFFTAHSHESRLPLCAGEDEEEFDALTDAMHPKRVVLVAASASVDDAAVQQLWAALQPLEFAQGFSGEEVRQVSSSLALATDVGLPLTPDSCAATLVVGHAALSCAPHGQQAAGLAAPYVAACAKSERTVSPTA